MNARLFVGRVLNKVSGQSWRIKLSLIYKDSHFGTRNDDGTTKAGFKNF